MTEDEMVGWHHRLDGHEFEQALGVGDGQRSLACCSPWGHKELDTKLKLQYSGHLMQRTDSFVKTLMLGKIEGRMRRGQQWMRWLDGMTQWT